MKKLLCATLLCFSITCFADNNFNDPNAIHQVYLNTGDIVFWKDINKADRAGHVAVVSQSSDTAENAKIMHSTDHPKYNAFVETHMLPSSKLLENNKYYWVIRIKDQKIRQAFIRTLNAWLQEKIPFNAESEWSCPIKSIHHLLKLLYVKTAAVTTFLIPYAAHFRYNHQTTTVTV